MFSEVPENFKFTDIWVMFFYKFYGHFMYFQISFEDLKWS